MSKLTLCHCNYSFGTSGTGFLKSNETRHEIEKGHRRKSGNK